MQEGWLLDEDGVHSSPAKWVAGAPQTTWLSGIKYNKKSAISIKAFRCASCSYLEFYAND